MSGHNQSMRIALLCWYFMAHVRSAEIVVEPLDFHAPNVVVAERMTETKTSLWVHFGEQGAINFSAVARAFHAQLEQSKAVPEAIFLIGHGGGITIGGTQLDAHLKANRTFYETLGGLRPAKPIACLVVASCARGAADQLVQMRDGLGYYPTWRVGTWPKSYASPESVLAAFAGICDRPAATPWRGLFLTGRADGTPASLGEVGKGGERGNLVYIDRIKHGDVVTWQERN